jgi:hypothetical protein
MAITPKELMLPPSFEGLAKFVYARSGNGDWSPSFTFEFFGGQVSVEVDESESLNPPTPGAIYQIAGSVRRSTRNGSITLAATEKKFVAPDISALSSEQMEQFVRGLPIRGVGVFEDKQAFQMARQTFMSATLRWQGATHQFKKLTPEMFQRIPQKGYVRFEMGLLVREERNQEGQMIILQIPTLVSVQVDQLVTGSVPSPAAQAKPALATAPTAAPAKV